MARAARTFCLLGVFPVTSALIQKSATHPVEDVISLLKKLGAQAEEEGKSEALTYQKFEHWCVTSKKTLKKTIAEEKETIEVLSDEIGAHKMNIEVLDKEITALTNELTKLGAAETAAGERRQKGADLYTSEKASLQGTIQAIGDAIAALQTSRTNTDPNPNLLQQKVRTVLALVGERVSEQQRAKLAEVAAPERPELKAEGDYTAHIKKYSFKSNSVIELLKELKLRFEADLLKTNTEETNAINAFQLSNEARTDLVNAATTSRQTKTSEKTTAEEDLNTAETDRRDTQSDLDADTSSLSSTTGACRVKKSEWEERSKTRAGEIEAIEAAIEILAKVTGVRVEPPSNPVPPASPVFLQLSNPKVQKAVELLRQEAKLAHSKAIDQLAQELVARKDGPFDEVVNMIEKMIFRLMHEQKEEDDHKNWCDEELNKTDESIAAKASKISELTVKIDAASAHQQSLAGEITDAQNMVEAIDVHMREATEIREIGKQENAVAVKDAHDAQTALANAIAVLKDFYKSSGQVPKESWEFLQRAHAPVTLPANPDTWSSAYTGVADPAAQPQGILTILQKVSADFARMESDTEAQDNSDQKAYEDDMSKCKIEKARRAKEVDVKTQEKKLVGEHQAELEATRKSTENEKEATEQYLKDLQPACVQGSSTYDDRKAARAKEVEALKEAQQLLQGAFNSTNSEAKLIQLHLRR